MATIQVRGDVIRATGGHPFWVVRGEGLAERPLPKLISAYEEGGRQEGRWVLARDLRVGDGVLLRHGEVMPVESVRLDEVEERVYNFNVAELQNYAVGECGILVHNTNEGPGPYAGNSIPARGPGRNFTAAERQQINQIGRNTGCHTCGTKNPGTVSGNFVPDHQPPNALNPPGGAQRLYPQCLRCSRAQGGRLGR